MNLVTLVCHLVQHLLFQVRQPHKPNRGVIGAAYHLNLRQMTCDCGRFQVIRYPCAHAVVACASKCLNYMAFIDELVPDKNS